MKRTTLAITTALLVATGCGGDKSSNDNEQALKNIGAIVVLQRAERLGGLGDVFQYTSYVPGARLIKLEPPTADGTRTVLCCDQYPEMAGLDIQSYDVSFDGQSIVFSGRIEGDSHYGLWVLTLDANKEAAGAPRQLALNPMRDHVYPVYAPQDRIIFVTNEVVEAGAPQHRDEYERGTTTQLASVSLDGTDLVLGPRHLSHRVSPTMLSDGRVLFTQWEHLGEKNEGDLNITNPDFTAVREAFGKEGSGVVNSYLKAVQMDETRLLAIGTTRDRTLQSGKILLINLGRLEDGVMRMSEEFASATDLTPLVPADGPSSPTVGRYYSVHPVRNLDGSFGDKPLILTSWSDGPVDQDLLGAAQTAPDFGIYLYDSRTGARLTVFNEPGTWEVNPRPLGERPAPPAIEPTAMNGLSEESLLIGSLNVHNSSIANIAPGSIVRVRVIEGFSVEEGFPNDFGLSEHEGAAMLGEVEVKADGSWAALAPANVPLHLQALDKFGMASPNEPVWFSGRPGESRFCGGCHESRSTTTVINPGITQAMAGQVANLDRPRGDRINKTGTYDRASVVGVPWDLALQPFLTTKCAGCHDGTDRPGNPSLTFTDEETAATQTIFFNLSGEPVTIAVGDVMMSGYSASHLSLIGPEMAELAEEGVIVTGDLEPQIVPGSAKTSKLFEKVNPMQFYPFDANTRFRQGSPIHPVDVGGQALTPDEYYLLILMADMGGQFFARENNPGGAYEYME